MSEGLKRPIKILRIMDRLNIGGPAIHAILLTKYFTSNGPGQSDWESTLVYGQEGKTEGTMLWLAEQSGIKPVYFRSLGRELHPLRDLVSLIRMIALVRREKPDIVHTHKSKAGVLGRLAAKICRVPVIVHTYHGHVLHGYFSPAKNAFFKTVERIMGRLSDRLIAVSPKVKEDLVHHQIAPAEKVKVLYLGLDLARFAARPRNSGALRRELGIPQKAPIVGIVARLVPIKNIPLFLKAAAGVLNRHPDARFVIVGDGECRSELEHLVDSMGIRKNVHFLGFRSNLEEIYSDFDVLGLTSSNEGSPVSLIEGLASGCAAVSTQVGGVPDVLRADETGVLIPVLGRGEHEIATDMARHIGDLLDDPERRRHLGEKGKADVLSRFPIQRLVADLDRLYRESLKEKVL
jgi:glycosyltransferase involved in cell wall biosynthesis